MAVVLSMGNVKEKQNPVHVGFIILIRLYNKILLTQTLISETSGCSTETQTACHMS